jgi:lipopolysaccharide export system protein LptA
VNTRQHLQAALCRGWIIKIKVLFIILTPMVLSIAAVAGDQSQANESLTSDEQIQIVADKLITNDQQKFADFIGNVRANQGAFVITSERLRIYYQRVPVTVGGQTTNQESVKQVVASDNVHVDTGKYTAKTDRLEYDLETQVIVLIGENSTIKSKNNVLTGSKITIDRKSGQMQVESQPQQQVKALFYPDQSTEKKE